MKIALIVLAGIAYVTAGIVVLVLHGRKKLAAHVSDFFDMLLVAAPGPFVILGVVLWPIPLLLGVIADKLTLKTSLESGDGKD